MRRPSALSARFPRLFGRKLMRSSGRVRRFSAFARDFADEGPIHGGEASGFVRLGRTLIDGVGRGVRNELLFGSSRLFRPGHIIIEVVIQHGCKSLLYRVQLALPRGWGKEKARVRTRWRVLFPGCF
jgi:hypothetical protein